MSKTFDPSVIQPSLAERLPQYMRINDCIAGADAIKGKKEIYLPKPDPTNDSDENDERYKQYLIRAIFYNVTARTVHGLTGMVFKKPQPSLDIPDSLDYLMTNIDGSGISLIQQIKKLLNNVIALGRGGLLVDYSNTTGTVSVQDVTDGKVRAVINRYDAVDIVWAETDQIGVHAVLSLVILKENYSIPSGDGYTSVKRDRYRVLQLIDGVYSQEIWKQEVEKQAWEKIDKDSFTPVDDKDRKFDHIPFTFIGSVNNDILFDEPPMLSIADLNIGHYRNSADAEEASFVVGQPTVAISGLTKTWVDDVMKGVVRLGARGGIPLPDGAKAELLQVTPNLMPVEGMVTKELQMSQLGAQVVNDSAGDKTATEITRDSDVEDSVLSTIVQNVEQAYEFCFENITLFTGVDGFAIELNKIFINTIFNPQTYISLVNGAMQGANGKEEIFDYLQLTGMVDDDIEFETWLSGINDAIPSAV